MNWFLDIFSRMDSFSLTPNFSWVAGVQGGLSNRFSGLPFVHLHASVQASCKRPLTIDTLGDHHNLWVNFKRHPG
jgi:hypothetical protein